METVQEYQLQLKVIENALKTTAPGPERDELLSLKENIEELLLLTTETANILKRDTEVAQTDILSSQNTSTPAPSQKDTNNDGASTDEEWSQFMSEMEQEGAIETQGVTTKDNEEYSEEDYKKIKELEGQKCQAPYKQTWGQMSYHNAMICSVPNGAGSGQNLQSTQHPGTMQFVQGVAEATPKPPQVYLPRSKRKRVNRLMKRRGMDRDSAIRQVLLWSGPTQFSPAQQGPSGTQGLRENSTLNPNLTHPETSSQQGNNPGGVADVTPTSRAQQGPSGAQGLRENSTLNPNLMHPETSSQQGNDPGLNHDQEQVKKPPETTTKRKRIRLHKSQRAYVRELMNNGMTYADAFKQVCENPLSKKPKLLEDKGEKRSYLKEHVDKGMSYDKQNA